jgi:hypothetical protein
MEANPQFLELLGGLLNLNGIALAWAGTEVLEATDSSRIVEKDPAVLKAVV